MAVAVAVGAATTNDGMMRGAWDPCPRMCPVARGSNPNGTGTQLSTLASRAAAYTEI